MNGWHSVNEQLPRKGERVMVCQQQTATVRRALFARWDGERWEADSGTTLHNVTHWQRVELPNA